MGHCEVRLLQTLVVWDVGCRVWDDVSRRLPTRRRGSVQRSAVYLIFDDCNDRSATTSARAMEYGDGCERAKWRWFELTRHESAAVRL